MAQRTAPIADPTPLSLSVAEARSLILAQLFRSDAGRGVPKTLEDFGYVQIDTISRVERAHHHCLWTRNSEYRSTDLERAVAEAKVFEYWSHAAAYLPTRSYRYCLPRMERMRANGSDALEENQRVIKWVLDRIRAEGPLMSRDFKEENHSSEGWWDWKPTKMALENLFHQGRLAIKERRGFQKVYAFPEDVLPDDIDTTMPSDTEMAAYLIDLSLRNTGMSRRGYLSFQHSDGRATVPKRLSEELETGSVVAVEVKGTGLWYCRPSLLERIDSNADMTAPGGRGRVKILSPFDGLVIQRGLLAELFAFSYQVECYVPAKKRRYGYFSLPIIDQRGFAGMVDVKAERKEEVLRVHTLYLYKEYQRDQAFMRLFATELDAFARFNGCATIEYEPGSRHVL